MISKLWNFLKSRCFRVCFVVVLFWKQPFTWRRQYTYKTPYNKLCSQFWCSFASSFARLIHKIATLISIFFGQFIAIRWSSKKAKDIVIWWHLLAFSSSHFQAVLLCECFAIFSDWLRNVEVNVVNCKIIVKFQRSLE